jgi:hypothetical protein
VILNRQQAKAIAGQRKTTHHTTHATLKTGARIPISVRQPNGTSEIICHAEITAIEPRQLRDLTRDEARAEGYDGARGPLVFRRAWLQQHDRSWFEAAKLTETGLTDELVARRWRRHEGTPVHVLELRLAEPPDRWMARSSGRLTSHQTTSDPRSAIDDLPVAPQEFVDALANKANENRTHTLAEARKEAALESFAIALHRARGKQASNMVRAAERMAKTVDRDTA